MRKIRLVLMVTIMMVAMSWINSSNYTQTFAAPFGYNVGDTFVVEGYTFKIVNKEARQAVSVNGLIRDTFYVARNFALGFATRNPSYINSSGLPTKADYDNATWRANVGNLSISLGEWTSTFQLNPDRYWIGYSEGTTDWNGNIYPTDHAYARPALYLKPGLSISGPGGTLSADTTPPTCTITANPTADPTNASSITYTFTFNEPVTGFDTTDITVTNGTKGTFTATSTSVYTLVVTNTGSVTQTVSVAAGRCTDLAGNNNIAASKSVTIDRTAPTAAITYSPAGPYKSGTVVTITATFSEVMNDSPVPRIAISGANTLAATNMTKTSTTVYRYTYTVGAGNGTATVALSTGQDNVGNVVTAVPTSGATFTVDNTPPTNPTFVATPNNSTPTNGNVTVTITYSGDSTTRQYKIDSGAWINYTTAVVMTANGTIYARAADAVGNENTSASLSVTNIDKSPPVIILTPSITIPTNQNITVTASITDNLSGVELKKWALGNQPANYFLTNGTTLDTSFEVSENGTYTVYAKDIAGNETVQTILIGNIDKEAPGVPEFLPSTTLPIDKVTVTIKFPDGSHTKEYKIGEGSWGNYTEPLVIDKNITIYAKCADIVGNTTGETSLNIGNIEVNGSVEGIELDDRKHFRYYLGLGKNGITQCMLVAGNENGKVKHPFVREDIIDSATNKFKDGIFYIDIYGKIKKY